MDKEEKKAELSIRNNFIKWLNIEGLDSALFVVGNMITGKSTICHLLKRVVGNFEDPNLKFVQKKKEFEYEYEGEINPKATKPLTIYPKLYRIKKTNTNIIQVPSKFYHIEKKRPYLDRLLTVVGIAYAAKKGKFLFCVDAKNTYGKLDHWKKSFSIVFDAFEDQFFDEDMLNSMGFVFIKAKESDKQVYLRRIPDLRVSFTHEDIRKDLYLNLLNVIESKQRVGVFTKYSTEEAAQLEIKTISQVSESLSEAKMVMIKNGEEHHFLKMEPVELSKDEEVLYNNFKQTLELILAFFAEFYLIIFTTKGPVDIKGFLSQQSESLKAIIEKISSDGDKQQGQQSKVLNERYNELMEISTKKRDFCQSALGKCLFFVEYKKKVISQENIRYQYVKTMLEVLAEHGLVFKDFQDQLKPFYMELIIFSLFQERFGPLIVNFDFKSLVKSSSMTKAFSEENEKLVKQAFLNSSFSSEQSPQNSKLILSALDTLFTEQQIQDQSVKDKVSFIKDILMMSSFDTSSPEKGIPQIYEQIENLVHVKKIPQAIYGNRLENPQKQIQFMNKLALLLAQMLINYGRSDLCSGIFRDCGKYFSAKDCLQSRLAQLRDSKQTVSVLQPILMSYIDLLIEMSLSEKAMLQCFEYAQIYNELRSKLFEKMKEIKKRQNEPFSEDFEGRFTRQGVKLIDFYRNDDLLQKIRKIVTQIKK